MEVLILEVFVSLTLVAGAVLLFLHSTKHGDHQHGLRLALLPLGEDESTQNASGGTTAPQQNKDTSHD